MYAAPPPQPNPPMNLSDQALRQVQTKLDFYLTSRWKDQYEYYSKKASVNKKNYQRIRIIVALAGLAIPVLVTIPSTPSLITAFLGLLVSALTAWDNIYRYGDNWRAFRQAAEELKRERIYFDASVGPYKDIDPLNGFVTFVERCEAIMAQESGSFFKKDEQMQQSGQSR